MSKKRIAVNGFGRIGRLTTRVLLTKYRDSVDIVGINDLTSVDNLAYLMKYDTTYRAPQFDVRSSGDNLVLDGDTVPVFSSKDPRDLPWKAHNVDVVLECTGFFRDFEGVSKHLSAGAKQVVISAPAKDDSIPTFVLGVNDIMPNQPIYSNASCTTNCIAPALKALQDGIGIKRGTGLTVHAYTSTQRLQDSPSNSMDYRKTRAAANMIPTSTGAAKAVVKVMPELEGKLNLNALRVPVITGSMVELVVELERHTTKEEIMSILSTYQQQHPDILTITSDQIVSGDIIGAPFSTTVDESLTTYENGLLTLVLWYDNEWGYSNRLADMVMGI